MSDAFYKRTIVTAKRLIKKFGGQCTLHVTTDSADAWNPTQVTTDYPVIAAQFDYKNMEVDGTLIQSTDRKVYVSTEGVTIEPDVAHKITIDGVKHSIISVNPLKQPTRPTVLWILQVRA